MIKVLCWLWLIFISLSCLGGITFLLYYEPEILYGIGLGCASVIVCIITGFAIAYVTDNRH